MPLEPTRRSPCPAQSAVLVFIAVAMQDYADALASLCLLEALELVILAFVLARQR